MFSILPNAAFEDIQNSSDEMALVPCKGECKYEPLSPSLTDSTSSPPFDDISDLLDLEFKDFESFFHSTKLDIQLLSDDGDGLTCAVCGDRATGFHYGVNSCNGCKTFYRRTIVTGRKFKCNQGGNCVFDKNHRCICRACRFDRCVSAGMNSGAIQYKASANLMLSSMRRKIQKSLTKNSIEKRLTLICPEILKGAYDEVLQIIQNTQILEEKLIWLRNSSFFPSHDKKSIKDVIDSPSVFSDCNKYPLVKNWPKRPATKVSHFLYPQYGIKFWLYTDLYLGMEYLKTFEFFRELPVEEKLSLVKSTAIINQMLTQSFSSFLIKSDVVIYPDGFRLFMEANRKLTDLEYQIRHGVIETISKLGIDQIECALLRSIIVLNEACIGISDVTREIIAKTRQKYTQALSNYLKNKHGISVGMSKFGEDLLFIAQLYNRKMIHTNYFSYRHYVLMNASPIPIFREFML